MIDTEKETYSISLLCKVLEVSRSGYYAWLKRPKSSRDLERERLVPLVLEISKDSRSTYGARRIVKELSLRHGISCTRYKAGTLMDLAGVYAKQKRKYKVTTDSKHNLPVSPNLLDRNFSVARPDEVYVSDITYIWSAEGWLYLAVVIDLFSREVVGWSLSRNIDRNLVIGALNMAILRRRPAPGLIFHSDRGSQYCSHDFRNLLDKYGIVSSMSRKGDCWDNAVCESFFGTLKGECVYHKHYSSRIEAKSDIVDYIEMFYNSKRLHSYLGYVSPRQFEEKNRIKKVA
jgi:transposase InsO family protein